MSTSALNEFDKARQDQVTKNEARRIRTKVSDARNAPAQTALRWPFELLQNALDAGPRPDRQTVHVRVSWTEQSLLFEHDGAPFGPKDLAALLSGGSNKDFESEETTGRFGTGFLSTHVLSTKVAVSGLLSSSEGMEWFELELERGGDENSIIENIKRCDQAIRDARPVQDERPSGRFVYAPVDTSVVQLGLSTLRLDLPLLFSTCPRLEQVTLNDHGREEHWSASPASSVGAEGRVIERTVHRRADAEEATEFRSFRFPADGDESAAVLCVVRKLDAGLGLELPDDTAPRLYCSFPVRPSYFLGTRFVIDCRFDLNQERNQIPLNDKNFASVQRALAVIPRVMQHAEDHAWAGRHLLARIEAPAVSSGQTQATEWRELLKEMAQRLAVKPIIETPRGMGTAIKTAEGTWFVDFLLPWRPDASIRDMEDTSIDRFWVLLNAAKRLIAPVRGQVKDWSITASGWADLGLQLNRLNLTAIAAAARPKSARLTDLDVEGDASEWLARLVDLVGEAKTKGVAVPPETLEKLIPDQNGRLCSPRELKREQLVPDELKDIAKELGYDVRSLLVDRALSDGAERLGLSFFRSALMDAVPQTLSEREVVDECLGRLRQSLKDGMNVKKGPEPVLIASQKLLAYLWNAKGIEAAEPARSCPLVTEEGAIVWTAGDYALMAPSKTWHASAQPFAEVYPKARILAARYADESGTLDVVKALVAWRIAHADPLISVSKRELKEQGLKAAAVDPATAEGVVLEETSMSGIALLHHAIFPRCNESLAAAQALLGLVLQHIAPHDPRWRREIEARGRRAGTDVTLRIHPAVWLVDLKTRAWVPVRGQDGKVASVHATPAMLHELLQHEWLRDNQAAMMLLTEHFGFDALDLCLLGGAADEATRKEVRASLAELLKISGADPGELRRLSNELDEKRRQIQRLERYCSLGLAIQEVIRQLLSKNAALQVKLIDRGYDYAVTYAQEPAIEAGTPRVRVGSWLLEVKATTTGEVRLTPLQAKTASESSDRFVLCVVDLRGVPVANLDRDWSPEDVAPRTRIVCNVGEHIAEPWQLVQEACGSNIALRNEDSLRYAVPATIWGAGENLAEWVKRCVLGSEAAESASA